MSLFKKAKKFFSDCKRILFVLFVTFISYGNTLRMYFWQDDSALIFKLQNPEGAAGSFGYGIIGEGPYKYLVSFYYPFFSFFGTNPFWYFLVGFLTYIIAIYLFYRFSYAFFLKSRVAYLATLIFASGYIGSEIMFRVINSWQTNIGLIISFLMFEQLVKYLKTDKLVNYIASVFLYWLATELVFIRSHSLIMPIILLFVLLKLKNVKLRTYVLLIIYQIPFLSIFYSRYLTDSGFGGPSISQIYNNILDGKIEVLAPLFANIGNSLVISTFQTWLSKILINTFSISDLYNQIVFVTGTFTVCFIFVFLALISNHKRVTLFGSIIYSILFMFSQIVNLYLYNRGAIWYRDLTSVVSGSIGLNIITLGILLFFSFYKKNKIYAVSIILGIVFASSQIFGYYVQYPQAVFSSTHRYFSYSLIGFALFYAGMFSLLDTYNGWRKALGFTSIFLIIISNLYLGFTYQNRLIKERSEPTRKFYESLISYVPEIRKGAAFYFDVSNDGVYGREFGDFFSVGSMPESTALAMYYKVDRYDVLYITDFDELIYKVNSKEVSIDNLYTFYYGANGLVDTTSETRSILNTKNNFVEYESFNSINLSPLSPIMLKVTLVAKKPVFDNKTQSPSNLSTEEKVKVLEYLISRNRYYGDAKIKSESEWKFREIRNAIDSDLDTPWQGHRIHWHENEYDYIEVDLGEIKNIDRVLWINWKETLAPIKYSFEISLDGQKWTKVKEVKNGPQRKDGEVVIEEFASINAKYVRMNIDETQSNDSPAVVEFEVIEATYNKVDPLLSRKYEELPLGIVKNVNEFDVLFPYIRSLANLNVTWETDKKNIYDQNYNIPLYVDSQAHTYDIIIDAGGTKLSNLEVTSNINAIIDIKKIEARNLSFEEMGTMGLIKTFTEN